MPAMSVEEYAAHRGVTPRAVYAALKAERIAAIPDTRPLRIDSDAADATWDRQPDDEPLPLLEFEAPGANGELPPELQGAARYDGPPEPPTTDDGRALLTLAEYAAHRAETDQRGTTVQAIYTAIKAGRIEARKVAHPAHREPILMVDPEQADREWSAQRDDTDPIQPTAAGRSSSKGDLEHYRAQLARLEFEERAGDLVPRARVKLEWSRIARTLRERLSEAPGRAGARLTAFIRERVTVSAGTAQFAFTERELAKFVEEALEESLSSVAASLQAPDDG